MRTQEKKVKQTKKTITTLKKSLDNSNNCKFFVLTHKVAQSIATFSQTCDARMKHC